MNTDICKLYLGAFGQTMADRLAEFVPTDLELIAFMNGATVDGNQAIIDKWTGESQVCGLTEQIEQML